MKKQNTLTTPTPRKKPVSKKPVYSNTITKAPEVEVPEHIHDANALWLDTYTLGIAKIMEAVLEDAKSVKEGWQNTVVTEAVKLADLALAHYEERWPNVPPNMPN